MQVHISHIGEIKFKGVADAQSVVQFSTAHLAARQFPQDPPSAKAALVSALTQWAPQPQLIIRAPFVFETLHVLFCCKPESSRWPTTNK